MLFVELSLFALPLPHELHERLYFLAESSGKRQRLVVDVILCCQPGFLQFGRTSALSVFVLGINSHQCGGRTSTASLERP